MASLAFSTRLRNTLWVSWQEASQGGRAARSFRPQHFKKTPSERIMGYISGFAQPLVTVQSYQMEISVHAALSKHVVVPLTRRSVARSLFMGKALEVQTLSM